MIRKKRRIIIFLSILFLSSCGPGTQDWNYELPNGYRVSRYNSKDIHVAGGTACKSDSQYTNSFVTDFSYDKQYVFTKHIINETEIKYYILDTKNDLLYGAFNNYVEMENKSHELDIDVPDIWISTENNPVDNVHR